MMINDDILREVGAYYTDKLLRFGQSPRGVDWNGTEGQIIRFMQLTNVIEETQRFSVVDFGCGYGALVDYIRAAYADFQYSGLDVSSEMVKAATERHRELEFASFTDRFSLALRADYGIASGLFNVRLSQSDSRWWSYLVDCLDQLNSVSERGFSFNCLTKYCDPEKMKKELYYADPGALMDLCVQRYSRHIAILQDYGLYE